MDMSLWEIIKIGSIAMYIIIALSVVAVAVALERFAALWAFMDKARALSDTVNRCLFRGAVAEGRAACERSRSPLADVFLVGFERMGRTSRESLDAAVDRERLRVTLNMKTRLWILGSIGAAAPFVGLYGTVVGIMHAFNAIAVEGGGGFTVVSKGIAEALVCTAAGILVAIIAVAFYNFFVQHLARTAVEMKMMVDEFLEVLRERGGDGGTAPRAPSESSTSAVPATPSTQPVPGAA
jgi:biopolymer transport protein ExbB/TolQ